MKELGLKMAPLRYSDSIIEMSTGLSASHADHKTGAPTSDMESRQLNISEKKWLQGRMLNGFSFVRYRPNSGEETTALYRGPVSPVRSVKDQLPGLCTSNDGTSLQLIDY